jgi:hypothetical protein
MVAAMVVLAVGMLVRVASGCGGARLGFGRAFGVSVALMIAIALAAVAMPV